jgi:hypothetical protein
MKIEKTSKRRITTRTVAGGKASISYSDFEVQLTIDDGEHFYKVYIGVAEILEATAFGIRCVQEDIEK